MCEGRLAWRQADGPWTLYYPKRARITVKYMLTGLSYAADWSGCGVGDVAGCFGPEQVREVWGRSGCGVGDEGDVGGWLRKNWYETELEPERILVSAPSCDATGAVQF